MNTIHSSRKRLATWLQREVDSDPSLRSIDLVLCLEPFSGSRRSLETFTFVPGEHSVPRTAAKITRQAVACASARADDHDHPDGLV